MPLRLIYGCQLKLQSNYTSNDGTLIDGWTLINTKLRDAVKQTPFEILYHGDHRQWGYVLVYETMTKTDEIVLDITAKDFDLRTNRMDQYLELLKSVGVKFSDFKPTLMVVIA